MKTETDEEIRVTVPEGGWCRHCVRRDLNGGTLPALRHEHVWKKPRRCIEALGAIDGRVHRCELNAGHDSGEFPRPAWDDRLDNVRRIIFEPTPHVASWT